MTKFKVGDKIRFKKSRVLDIMQNNCNGIVKQLPTSWFKYYLVECEGQSYFRMEEELNHSNYYFQQQEAKKLLGLK